MHKRRKMWALGSPNDLQPRQLQLVELHRPNVMCLLRIYHTKKKKKKNLTRASQQESGIQTSRGHRRTLSFIPGGGGGSPLRLAKYTSGGGGGGGGVPLAFGEIYERGGGGGGNPPCVWPNTRAGEVVDSFHL